MKKATNLIEQWMWIYVVAECVVMAYLLGSQSCINSLRVDIEDLQNVIHDILTKTGSIKCYSWKFPDQLATDVQIKEILERYQFSKNELDNQVAHVILFEILIDRLLLVLHGSWRYFHDIQTKFYPHLLDSSSTINEQTGLSVGLITKKYWNKLLQLFNAFQTTQKLRIDEHRKRSKSHLVAADKTCQTIETSFTPCSSCQKFQNHFHQSSSNILHLCNTYDLPSSLAFHRCATSLVPEWLSSEELDFQQKDFDRLAKHLEYLTTTVNQLKIDLQASEQRTKEHKEGNERLEKNIHDEQQSNRVLQKKLIDLKKEYDANLEKLNEQLKELTNQKNHLQHQCQENQEQWNSRMNELEKLESTKNQLKLMTEDRQQCNQLKKLTEENGIRLQTELDVLKRELDERHNELKKERMRIEKFIRQEENSQSKEKHLIQSNEQISHECQLLKTQLSHHNQLQKDYQQLLETMNALKLNLLDRSNESTSSMLLHQQQAQEMQIQLRIKDERLNSLQKENQTLKISLDKLQTAIATVEAARALPPLPPSSPQSFYTHLPPTETIRPKETPLWLLNHEILEQKQQQAFTDTKPVTASNYIPRFSENDYAANGWIRSEPDVIPIQPRPVTRIASSRPIPPASEHEMVIGKGRSKLSNRPSSFEHSRRNVSSARQRRSSTTNISHRFTN